MKTYKLSDKICIPPFLSSQDQHFEQELADKICLLPFFGSVEDPDLNFQVIFYVSFYAKVRQQNILIMTNTFIFKVT